MDCHRLLGDASGGAPPVVHAAEIYRINVRAGIAVDVTAFEALARRGDRHWHAGAWPTAGSSYREAITLYRGDLHACTDDSAVVERERLRAAYLVMFGRLADIARREHDYSSVLEYASLVVTYDATREDAHRTLACCYAFLGERVQAMRQYLLCERLLQETPAVPHNVLLQLPDHIPAVRVQCPTCNSWNGRGENRYHVAVRIQGGERLQYQPRFIHVTAVVVVGVELDISAR